MTQKRRNTTTPETENVTLTFEIPVPLEFGVGYQFQRKRHLEVNNMTETQGFGGMAITAIAMANKWCLKNGNQVVSQPMAIQCILEKFADAVSEVA